MSAEQTSAPDREIPELLAELERLHPTASSDDTWYLTVIGAFIGSNKGHFCGHLYDYLLRKDCYASAEQRQALIRRMREVMIKCVILCGLPSVYDAVRSIVVGEQEADKDYTFSRQDWRRDDVNEQRGLNALQDLHSSDYARVMDKFDAHEDLAMISNEVAYGLFLAYNPQILNPLETELVCLSAVMCQNLRIPAKQHLRGCLRIGIGRNDVESIQQCIRIVAKYAERTIEDADRESDIGDNEVDDTLATAYV